MFTEREENCFCHFVARTEKSFNQGVSLKEVWGTVDDYRQAVFKARTIIQQKPPSLIHRVALSSPCLKAAAGCLYLEHRWRGLVF